MIAALRERSLWPTTTSPRTRRKTTRYQIRNVCGHVVAVHVRDDDGAGGKRMSWRLPDGTSGLGGRPVSSLPLYRSERLAEALTTMPVIVCEGERATDALASIGVLAVGTVTGASGTPDDDVLRDLVGRDVVLWPDHDDAGEQHMRRIADRLEALGVTPRRLRWPGAREKGDDAADFFERGGTEEDLAALMREARPCSRSMPGPPGVKIISAEELLAESDDPITYLCDRVLSPGAVTILCAPRGTGKSHYVHGLATAVATGVRRVGTTGERLRVLLVDRDNPRRVTRERLRRWRRQDQPLDHLGYLGRDDGIASLLDPQWWANLPLDDYAAVILDSLGSLLPGVDDKDTAAYGRGIATAIAIAGRGPAVALLANPIKDASAIRGSGVTSDRVDAVYELRDITGWQPDGRGEDWWSTMPDGGESAYASRASRRKGETTFRLAFVTSKERRGVESDPFAIEIQLPSTGDWELREVTDEIVAAHAEARGAAAGAAEKRRDAARDALAALVIDRHAAGNPLSEAAAIEWLKQDPHEMGRNEASRLIASGGSTNESGRKWVRSGSGRKGSAYVLVPADPAPDSGRQREESDPALPVAGQWVFAADSSRSCGPRAGRIEVAQAVVPQGLEGSSILPDGRPGEDVTGAAEDVA